MRVIWRLKFNLKVTDAAVNSAGVPETDHRLLRLDLVFNFMPRRLCAVKPRIDRTLLEDPVVKLKFQSSVVDFIDAAQKGQYAARTTQFPSMVAHTLPPGHPGTEFAPARVLVLHLNVLQRSTLRW